jgi:prepilin-type N-terminal cleavage/methylation domain-containing protein
MRRGTDGFTLLEVLVAILIVTMGLLGVVGTLGPVASLAGEGKARGRAALQLTSRLNRLRSELQALAPDCVAPLAGSELHGAGIRETWTAFHDGRLVEVQITVTAPRARGEITDTLVTRIPCP